MNLENLPEHLVQSPIWGKFKTQMGTPAYTAGGVQFTLHKLPLLPYYLAYAPKINLKNINYEEVGKVAESKNAVAVRFDAPNVVLADDTAKSRVLPDSGSTRYNVAPAPKDTFAKYNILLDLTPNEETLFKNLKSKTRYNIRLAQKNGVVVKKSNDINTFLELNRKTAKRQGFFVHADSYYKTMFEILQKEGLAYLFIAYLNNEPLVAWILICYQGVLYYPYGASSEKHKEVMASNLMMWEAIKFGKEKGCKLFDMWGATNDEKDPWWGFTRFKLGYGGELVKYMDSFDLVINKPIYRLFNGVYRLFWFFLNLKKLWI
ncbi:MAG: peptidoglycan bridge formation glycyltransferase FemA/FemB family protein [Patescibacteria group bacterium]